MKLVKGMLQHYLNPLHVFCRLMDLGIQKKRALLIAGYYEVHMYPEFMKH